MAPASAHGNPGYGIYTTRAVQRGESFLKGPDVPSIPILDYSSNDDDDDDEQPYSSQTNTAAAVAAKALRGRARQHFINTFSNYWWTHGKPDHVAYLSGQSADFQLTFGALPNHHCLLQSLEAHYPTTSYADRRAVQSPAAGAYSYHNGRVFVAGRPVAAGEEIYLNYGMWVSIVWQKIVSPVFLFMI
jgi:SET domain